MDIRKVSSGSQSLSGRPLSLDSPSTYRKEESKTSQGENLRIEDNAEIKCWNLSPEDRHYIELLSGCTLKLPPEEITKRSDKVFIKGVAIIGLTALDLIAIDLALMGSGFFGFFTLVGILGGMLGLGVAASLSLDEGERLKELQLTPYQALKRLKQGQAVEVNGQVVENLLDLETFIKYGKKTNNIRDSARKS